MIQNDVMQLDSYDVRRLLESTSVKNGFVPANHRHLLVNAIYASRDVLCLTRGSTLTKFKRIKQDNDRLVEEALLLLMDPKLLLGENANGGSVLFDNLIQLTYDLSFVLIARTREGTVDVSYLQNTMQFYNLLVRRESYVYERHYIIRKMIFVFNDVIQCIPDFASANFIRLINMLSASGDILRQMPMSLGAMEHLKRRCYMLKCYGESRDIAWKQRGNTSLMALYSAAEAALFSLPCDSQAIKVNCGVTTILGLKVTE